MAPRTKNILLVLGFCLAIVIAYNLAFSKTATLKNRINILETRTNSLENSVLIAANLEQRERFVDSILSLNNIKGNSVQNNLLEFLNIKSESGNFTISDFNEPHTFSDNGATTTSYQFTLEGNYIGIEQVLYSLEQEYNFGQIAHVHFENKKDYRKGRDYLECFVILESLVSE
mgnify:CR=1 FL=1|jgi:hypothetical protein|tara:strand:+ start:14868 stop:15386 length:519 start_codon:yes stop_codon:yes gene_type:complete